jgi:transcriptional regulator with XRE-family HTH domain
METVAPYLRQIRAAAGLTQAEAAERIGVSSKTVERWEAGKHEPPASELAAYVKALEGSVAEVMRRLIGSSITEESDDLAVINRLRPEQRRLVAELARQILREEFEAE